MIKKTNNNAKKIEQTNDDRTNKQPGTTIETSNSVFKENRPHPLPESHTPNFQFLYCYDLEN